MENERSRRASLQPTGLLRQVRVLENPWEHDWRQRPEKDDMIWSADTLRVPLHVRKPMFSEADPEAAIREGADELTWRADEVGTLRAFINRWEPPLVDADWHAFCQAIRKRIEGEAREELYCHHLRDEQGNRSQKAK